MLHYVLLLCSLGILSIHSQDLSQVLSRVPPVTVKAQNTIILPVSYDIQIQFPLSEVSDPDTPLFTARVVIQFDLTEELRANADPESHVLSTSVDFSILGLDHFENVSVVYNGLELPLANVILTEDNVKMIFDQPVLFPGRYTLSIQRYKGFIGSALYYRDAGDHAVFGSSLFPKRVAALFPVISSIVSKVPISLTIVHPNNMTALSSAPVDGPPASVDENWMVTSFRPTAPIGPGSLAIALLPMEYDVQANTLTGILLSLHYNKYRMTEKQALGALSHATKVVALLRSFFSSAVPMAQLDIVVINDVIQSNSYGTIIIPEDVVLGSDTANLIYILAGQITRQWLGGIVTVSNEKEICLQEDLAEYVALKVVKRMTNDEGLRLALYAKVMMNEDFFENGHNLELDEVTDREITSICGLKGVLFLESIESIIGERDLLQHVNALIFTTKDAHFNLNSFMKQISSRIDEDVDLAQVYAFWFRSRGVPHLMVKRVRDSLQLTQITNRTMEIDGVQAAMTIWPLILDFSDFQLPLHFMLSQGIHLAPVRDSLSLSNLGFRHFYRVNYDVDTWRQVKDALFHNTSMYARRERAQLVSDFCFFYQKGEIEDEVKAEKLRAEFIQMVRLKSSDFELCELVAWGCGAGSIKRKAPRDVLLKLRRQLWDAMRNEIDFSCGRGAVHSVADLLCRETTGSGCL
ncbi:unnamed protein product, partial [Mesorhabditis belari]|uniref:Peptidase M1 membrane alanine aminopeptidase domain-containing protein n=1 Tax=Mesorhabditis belari TaxID=2138241 RepID=A0AAF3F212_9BILA